MPSTLEVAFSCVALSGVPYVIAAGADQVRVGCACPMISIVADVLAAV